MGSNCAQNTWGLVGKETMPSEHFHFDNALTDYGASLVRAKEE
jgi:hypothetical protein